MAEEIVDRVLDANRRYASGGGHPTGLARKPALKLAVVTCMDARIDPLRAFGLEPGDAHIVRTAGAAVGEDVLRSVGISYEAVGTRDILLIAHTDCAARDGDGDAEAAALRDADALRSAFPEATVTPLMYDVGSGELRLLGA